MMVISMAADERLSIWILKSDSVQYKILVRYSISLEGSRSIQDGSRLGRDQSKVHITVVRSLSSKDSTRLDAIG